MVRLLGSLLIGSVAAYMAISLSERLKRQLAAVGAMRNAVLSMKQKLLWYRLPLPTLLREISVEQGDLCSPFLAKAAGRLETAKRKPAAKILTECLREEPGLALPDRAIRSCMRLFSTLGQADIRRQEEIFDRVIGELDELEGQLREDLQRRGRCFWALGICGGLAIAIVLV